MQPKYLAILTLPLKADEKTITRCRKDRWSSYDFLLFLFIFYYYFIIIFVYLVYLFIFVFICLANRQWVR